MSVCVCMCDGVVLTRIMCTHIAWVFCWLGNMLPSLLESEDIFVHKRWISHNMQQTRVICFGEDEDERVHKSEIRDGWKRQGNKLAQFCVFISLVCWWCCLLCGVNVNQLCGFKCSRCFLFLTAYCGFVRQSASLISYLKCRYVCVWGFSCEWEKGRIVWNEGMALSKNSRVGWILNNARECMHVL